MSIRLEVMLNPACELECADVWIVVDVLRATTMMTTFFERGGKVILPVKSVEEAYDLKRKLGSDWLLMGERNSLPPPNFDCGNSPVELLDCFLGTYEGAIMTTTNGTKALLLASTFANTVCVGCVRNATAVLEVALKYGNKIGILCAGRFNRAMIDDTACAGLMVDIVRDRVENVDLNDGGKIALAVWEHYDKNMLEVFKDAEHAQSLRALGLWSDVEYAALQDESKIVPKLAIWQGLKTVIV